MDILQQRSAPSGQTAALIECKSASDAIVAALMLRAVLRGGAPSLREC
jgi:hypothetical protein